MDHSLESREIVRPEPTSLRAQSDNRQAPNVSVQIFEQFADDISGKWIADIARAALFVDSGSTSGNASVVIADDETVGQINEEYRGLPGVTDVLSFSNIHSGAYYGDDARNIAADMSDGFVMSPEVDAGLGEVIISYPQTCRQARDAGRSVKEELAQLVAHGIFHLLGYDHEEPDEAERMRSKERRAMAAFAERGLLK